MEFRKKFTDRSLVIFVTLGLLMAAGSASIVIDNFGQVESSGSVQEAVSSTGLFNVGDISDDTFFENSVSFYGGTDQSFTQLVNISNDATTTTGLTFETTYNEDNSNINGSLIDSYHVISDGLSLATSNGSNLQRNTDNTEVTLQVYQNGDTPSSDDVGVFVTSQASGESGGFTVPYETEGFDVNVSGEAETFESHEEGNPDWITAVVEADGDNTIKTNSSITLQDGEQYLMVMADAGETSNTEWNGNIDFKPNFIFNPNFNTENNWFGIKSSGGNLDYPNSGAFEVADNSTTNNRFDNSSLSLDITDIGFTTGSGSSDYGSEILYKSITVDDGSVSNNLLSESIESVENVSIGDSESTGSTSYNLPVGEEKELSVVTDVGNFSLSEQLEISTDILPGGE